MGDHIETFEKIDQFGLILSSSPQLVFLNDADHSRCLIFVIPCHFLFILSKFPKYSATINIPTAEWPKRAVFGQGVEARRMQDELTLKLNEVMCFVFKLEL